MTSAPHSWRTATGRAAALVAAYLAVAVVFTWPLAAQPGTTITAQPFGDPLLNAWTLAWGADRLLHGFHGFWTGLFFYPYPDTVAYSEHLLGIAIFTAPIEWLTRNPVLALNLAIIASGVLAGVGTWLLAREITGRRDAAWVAGLAFACSPYRVPQIYHLQVLMSGWIPISLWALTKYFRTGERRWIALWALAFVLNAYSNGYFLFFAAVPTAVVIIHGLWTSRADLRRRVLDLGLASSTVLAALVPIVVAYVRVRRDQGLSRSLGDIIQYSPDLAAYGHVSDRLWLWAHVLPTGTPERELFPGLLVVLLALAALLGHGVADCPRSSGDCPPASASLCRLLRSQTWLYAAIAAIALALSLGPRPLFFGWRLPFAGPYAWVMTFVPGLDGLRVPARLATVVTLALAVLAAIGLDRLTRGLRRFPRRIAIAACSLVIAAEGYAGSLAVERFPTASMASDRAGYEWLREQPGGPVLELPVGDLRTGVRYLYRTLSHGHRIVNGYSGYGSALQDFVGTPFGEPERLDDALTMARALGIRWLVVHPPLYGDPGPGEDLARTLRTAPAQVVRVEEFGASVIAELRPLVPRRLVIDPSWRELRPPAFEASASHNPDRIGLAFDGDRGSRWLTGERQQGREWIELRFTASHDIARVRLEVDRRSLSDYPRGLVIAGSPDGTSFTSLFEGGVADRLAVSIVSEPKGPGIDITLPPNETRVLRLSTTGETRAWYWSVAELRVFER